jgi:hypothetical protein
MLSTIADTSLVTAVNALAWGIVSRHPGPQGRTLLPLTMPGLFEAALRFISRQPGTTIGAAAIAGFAGAVANLVALGLFSTRLRGQVQAIEPQVQDPRPGQEAALAQALLELLTTALGMVAVVAVISALVYPVSNGLLICTVGRDVRGQATNLQDAWAQVRGHVPRLLGQAVVILLVVAVITSPVVLPLSLTGQNPLLALGLATVLAPASLVAVLLLTPRLVLAPVCLVLEDLPVHASFQRAFQLVRGDAMRTLGITVAAVVVTSLLASVVSLPFTLLASTDPTSTLGVFASSLGRIVGTAVTLPVLCAVIALIYVDLRVRKENLAAALAENA